MANKITGIFLTLAIKEKVESEFNKDVKQLHTVGTFTVLSSYFLEAFNFSIQSHYNKNPAWLNYGNISSVQRTFQLTTELLNAAAVIIQGSIHRIREGLSNVSKVLHKSLTYTECMC